MHFSITNQLPQSATITVLPLLDDDQLGQYLQDLSALAGLSGTLSFRGHHKETMPIYVGGQCHYLLGMGKKLDLRAISDAFSHFVRTHRSHIGEQLGVNASRLQGPPKLIGEGLANGCMLGTYNIGLYKTTAAEQTPLERVWIQHEDAADLGEGVLRGKTAGETQCRIMDLMNAPANKMRPTDLASWAMLSGETNGFLVEVFSKKVMQEVGLHAVLAVNQGSATEPAFIICQYTPAKGDISSFPHIGLVGKGVTFDTGGLSIKTQSMHYMKSDMGGASMVLGAIELAAKWKLPVRITAIVPATENDVDANSVKPGDVINSFSGKTIEVVDTDAEGRLVLADGLFFMAKEHQPDVMIDAATLTGNSIMALGEFAGALMSNNDELAADLMEAGQQVGEKVWRMPLWEEYGEEMKSDIADVRNYSLRSYGGSITAGKFLEHFIGEHPKWAHLDIAGMVFGNTPYGKAKAANAFGVRLLVAYIEQLAQQKA